MVSVLKVTRSLIAGLAAGVSGWVVFILMMALNPPSPGRFGLHSTTDEWIFATLFGLLLGLSLGFVEGINAGSSRQLGRALLVFGFAACAGGFIGIFLGQIVFTALGGDRGSSFTGFFTSIIARSSGWGLWGVGTGFALGIGLGLVSGSTRRLFLAAAGGAIGGAAGGFAFQVLGYFAAILTNHVVTLLSFLCLSCGIAFCSALAQELFKQAWVKVLVGRGEGREFMIAKPSTSIGRDELADVPVFGDQAVAKRHLIINEQNGRYSVVAASQGLSFLLNGRSVSSAPLANGDIIQIGSKQIQFFEKKSAGRAPVADPSVQIQPVKPAVEAPPGTCAYCGQAIDALGQCGCSVGSAVPTPQPAGPTLKQMGVSAAQAILEIVAGPMLGQKLTLVDGQAVSVGRAPEADLSIQGDGFVSRRHARISVEGGIPYVQDQGSSNGTFVNGAKISRQALKPGDIISIGQTQIRVS